MNHKRPYHFDVNGEGLLAQHMQIRLNCLDGFLGMHRGGCSNGHGLETRVLEHLIIVGV